MSVVVNAFNPSSWEAEKAISLSSRPVQDLYSETLSWKEKQIIIMLLQDLQGYKIRKKSLTIIQSLPTLNSPPPTTSTISKPDCLSQHITWAFGIETSFILHTLSHIVIHIIKIKIKIFSRALTNESLRCKISNRKMTAQN